jgi:hypothetical protein
MARNAYTAGNLPAPPQRASLTPWQHSPTCPTKPSRTSKSSPR